MGGSNDPSNLIKLTIEEHAEAHRKLWEEHKKIEDYVAWKGLLGLFSRLECRNFIGWHKSFKHTEETKRKMSEIKKGKPRSLKSRLKQSYSVTGIKNHFYGKTHSEKFKKYQSERQKKRQIGSSNTRAIKVCVVDDKGSSTWGCIKDYALSYGIDTPKVQKFFREFSKNPDYRPKPGHITEKIISITRIS